MERPIPPLPKESLAKEPPPIPKSLKQEDLGFVRASMTLWFEPMRLFRLALQVIVSVLFGKYADNREIQAVLGQQKLFSYSDKDEIWFDYVADLGDGWTPTYTLAKILASETITATDPEQKSHVTERGSFLIMGGDQVYPSASRSNYQNQTEGPYRAALPWVAGDNPPHLYAIPGNHDWYDGLTSFTRLFCQKRWIGGWKTQQARSYFAIQLPHNWWFFAFDIQLCADIDKPQLDYFDAVINQLTAQDKVIFATATSAWLTASLTKDDEHENITFLEKRIVSSGARVYLNVAGDIHNYAHYQNSERSRHKITAGGGGAFLHYTHTMPRTLEVKEASGKHHYKVEENQFFPSPKVSKKVSRGALLFFLKNKSVSFFLSGYFLLALWVTQSASISNGGNLLHTLSQLPGSCTLLLDAIAAFLSVFSLSPASSLLFAIYIAGMVGFCEPPLEKSETARTLKRWAVGITHALLQLTLMIALTVFFTRLNPSLSDSVLGFIHPTLLLCLEVAMIGGVACGFVMGFYLYLSHTLFAFHKEAASSCNRIEDYKNFLRFHINASGDLKIYPMGIAQVEQNWVLNTKGKPGDSWLIPESGKSMSDYVHLIESPFTLAAKAAASSLQNQ